MELRISNIGKVTNAEIILKGITVIAGENNTGKSTIGKALFAAFNSMYQLNQKTTDERHSNIKGEIYRLVAGDKFYWGNDKDIDKAYDDKIRTEINRMIKEPRMSNENIEDLTDLIINTISEVIPEEKNQHIRENEGRKLLLDSIKESLNISDKEIQTELTSRQFTSEFDGQIQNVYSDEEAKVSLKIKKEDTSIIIQDNIVSNTSQFKSLFTQAVYIDDPFIMDEKYFGVTARGEINHRAVLKRQLSSKINNNAINKIVVDKKMDRIFNKINSIVDGELEIKGIRSAAYRPKGSEKTFTLKNISSGLKTFIILKTLLQNGSLQQNGTLILDEPEVHLHPEWQIVLAELIVLIQKEFQMHILLTTHSPYFLRAIEVYSEKYTIMDSCNYYSVNLINNEFQIEKAESNLNSIYGKLVKPFQSLENIL